MFVSYFFQVHDKASHGMVRDPVILNHKPLLNGDFEFLGRQYRSSSEVGYFPCLGCSTEHLSIEQMYFWGLLSLRLKRDDQPNK